MARIEAGNESTLATQSQSMGEGKADVTEEESMEETAPLGNFPSLFTQHPARDPTTRPGPLIPDSDDERQHESMDESMAPVDNRFTSFFTQPANTRHDGRDAAPQQEYPVGDTVEDQQDHVLKTLSAGIDTANPVPSPSPAQAGEPGSSLGSKGDSPALAPVEIAPTPTPESVQHPAKELSSWGSSMFPSFTDSNAITQDEPSQLSQIALLPHSAQHPADDELSSLGSSMFPSSINDAFRLARVQGSFQLSQNVDLEDVRHYGSLPARSNVDQVEEGDGIQKNGMDVDTDQDQVSMISKPPSPSEGSNAAVIPGLTSIADHETVQPSDRPAQMDRTTGLVYEGEENMGTSNAIEVQKDTGTNFAVDQPQDMGGERRLHDESIPQAIPSSSSKAVQVENQEKARVMEVRVDAPSIPSIPITSMTQIRPGKDLDSLTVHQLRMLGIRYIDLGPPLPNNIVPTATQGVVVNYDSNSEPRIEVPAVGPNGGSSKGADKAAQKAKAVITAKEMAGRVGQKTNMTASVGNIGGQVAKKKKGGKNVAVAASVAVGPGSTKNTNVGVTSKKRDMAAAGLEDDGVDRKRKAVDVSAIATAEKEKVTLARKRTRRRQAAVQVAEKAVNREEDTSKTRDGTAVPASGSNSGHIAPTTNLTSTIVEKENVAKACPAAANTTRPLPVAKKTIETGPAKPPPRLLQFGKGPGAPGIPLSTDAGSANIGEDVFGPNTPIAKLARNEKEA
jgi:hypothetical protein